MADKEPDDPVYTRADGQPVRDFRGAWWALRNAAGLGRFVEARNKHGKKRMKWRGLLFHDFRRSAVRNMVHSGVPEVVATKLSGHKTRSVLERYNILGEADIEAAARKIEEGRMPRASTVADPTPPQPPPAKIVMSESLRWPQTNLLTISS